MSRPPPAPSRVFLCFMCAPSPSSSIQRPAYHDNSRLLRPSRTYSPDHLWLLAGTYSRLQAALAIKRLAAPARPPCKRRHHTGCVCRLHREGRRQEGCQLYILGFVKGERGGIWFYVPNSVEWPFQWTGKLLRTNCLVFNLKGKIKEMVDDQIVLNVTEG